MSTVLFQNIEFYESIRAGINLLHSRWYERLETTGPTRVRKLPADSKKVREAFDMCNHALGKLGTGSA